MAQTINLTRGFIAIVDDDDLHLVSQRNWCVMKGRKGRHYAIGSANRSKGQKHILMHRLIMGNPVGMQVDHRNEEATLDNRKINLRVATHGQNQMNTGKHSHNTSGYKWVSWCKIKRKFVAKIRANGKYYHLGYFADPAEAYKAACVKATELHAEFFHI